MVYGYRLKDKKAATRMVEKFAIKNTWQFSSDPKTQALEKWPAVVLLKADNIGELKAKAKAYDEGGEEPSAPTSSGDENDDGNASPPIDTGPVPLEDRLNAMSLSDLKQFAKENGFDESEYSKFTRSKLVEYLMLGMSGK